MAIIASAYKQKARDCGLFVERNGDQFLMSRARFRLSAAMEQTAPDSR